MKRSLVAALITFSSCNKDTVIDMTPINEKGEILFISRRISNSADWTGCLTEFRPNGWKCCCHLS